MLSQRKTYGEKNFIKNKENTNMVGPWAFGSKKL